MESVKAPPAPLDLSKISVRELNQFLHHELPQSGVKHVEILHPNGMHNLAVGVDADVEIDIRGHAGYFIGGMNKRARITVHGSVGWTIGEQVGIGRPGRLDKMEPRQIGLRTRSRRPCRPNCRSGRSADNRAG